MPPSSNATSKPTGGPAFAGEAMRYIAAWLLGVPLSVIVVWYFLSQAACGA